MAGNLKKKGTVATFLRHEHPDWTTNRDVYSFPDFRSGEIALRATKNADRTITIAIDGPFDNSYDFTEQIPTCGEHGLHVAVKWKDESVTLYLNGKRVKTRNSPRTTH